MTSKPHVERGDILLTMIQDKIVNGDEARISALDRGLFFGDGVYEVVQSYRGRIWALRHHLARLDRSLQAIGIEDVDMNQLRERVLEAFDAVKRVDCLIYFHVTRGCAPRSHVPAGPLEPQFLLTVKPAGDNTAKARDGVTAITYPEVRWKRCDIKSLNLLPNVLARRQAYSRGASEAIFIDQDHVTEAAVSSLFVVIDDKLTIRPLGPEILPGITRHAVIAVAQELGIQIDLRPVTVRELRDCSELILTGTGEEVRSVVRLDDRTVRTGKVGPVAKRIIDFFVDHTRAGNSLEDLAGDGTAIFDPKSHCD